MSVDWRQLALDEEQAHKVTRRGHDRALDALSSVLSTLTRSAAAPADQAIYDRARAVLREHGIGDDVELHRQRCEAWERRERARQEVKP